MVLQLLVADGVGVSSALVSVDEGEEVSSDLDLRLSGSSREWGERNPGSLWESRENLGAAAKSRARARFNTVSWWHRVNGGGVVPQAAEEPRGPAGSHRKGFHGVRNQAEVRKRWLVNYLGHGVEQLSSGFRGVGFVRRRDIGVAIDASLVLLPSLRLLTTVSVGARVLLLVTGDFLLILVVTHAGGRVVVLYRLGSGGGLGRGRPLVDERLESLRHAVQGRSHASFRLLNHGAHLIPAGGSGGAPTAGVR